MSARRIRCIPHPQAHLHRQVHARVVRPLYARGSELLHLQRRHRRLAALHQPTGARAGRAGARAGKLSLEGRDPDAKQWRQAAAPACARMGMFEHRVWGGRGGFLPERLGVKVAPCSVSSGPAGRTSASAASSSSSAASSHLLKVTSTVRPTLQRSGGKVGAAVRSSSQVATGVPE